MPDESVICVLSGDPHYPEWVKEPWPCWAKALAWLDDRTGNHLPWGAIWLGKGPLRGLAFHFPSGFPSGFALTAPLPRMLPGFVKPYQIQSLRTREGRRNSDLYLTIPLLPPGRWSAYRTLRLRKRHVRAE